MAKFKVGDRVKAIKAYENNSNIVNEIGTIIAVDYSDYAVKFDNFIDGHSCNGKCEYGYGWWCTESILEPVANEKIVVTTDGVTTTAKMYHGKTVVKTATAKCNPDDKFDFREGAKIAVDRLLAVDVVSDDKPTFGEMLEFVEKCNKLIDNFMKLKS